MDSLSLYGVSVTSPWNTGDGAKVPSTLLFIATVSAMSRVRYVKVTCSMGLVVSSDHPDQGITVTVLPIVVGTVEAFDQILWLKV